MDKKRAILRIETDMTTGHSEVEVAGTPSKILFNLTAITCQVCEELNIPPEAWAAMMPSIIQGYKNTVLKGTVLKGKVAVGFNPFRNGGGTP